MTKRIELRYPLSCLSEGELIVPESVRRGRMKLTHDLLRNYLDFELVTEMIVGGEVEAEFQNAALVAVVTFWSPNSLSDRIKEMLAKDVARQLEDGIGEGGFELQAGGTELLFEVTDYTPTHVSEIDEERAPYPAPFVAMAAASEDENALRAAIEQHPDSVDAPLEEGRTALHYSLPKPAFVRMLLNAGADPNLVDIASMTPLNLILFRKKSPEAETLEIVQMLIAAGADLSIADESGVTPVENAKRSGKDYVLPLLS